MFRNCYCEYTKQNGRDRYISQRGRSRAVAAVLLMAILISGLMPLHTVYAAGNAGSVSAMINELEPVWNLGMEDIMAVEDARMAYEELSDSEKALVGEDTVKKLTDAIKRVSLMGTEPALTGMKVADSANASAWSVRTNLQVGDISHGDRTFGFSDIPEELIGADWIRPAMESKRWKGGATLVSFVSIASTELYVGWDNSTPLPEWLGAGSGFEKTDMRLSITNTDATVFELYKKSVVSGETIALGYVGLDKAVYITVLAHYTKAEIKPSVTTAKSFPQLGSLTVKNPLQASLWSICENLSVGDASYSDPELCFTEIPELLTGCTWLRGAYASTVYKSGAQLCEFTVNCNGYLYFAVEKAASADGIEAVPATITVGKSSMPLVRRRVKTGERVSIDGNFASGDRFIVFFKADALEYLPECPSISRFTPPFDTDGWYFIRENLSVGSLMFTNANTAVTELPEQYRGCEYIQTYRDDKKAVYFYSEREIEVSVTVDSRITTLPVWLKTWENTENTIKAGTRSYTVYTKAYGAGEFITVPQLDVSYDNYIVIVRPVGKTAETPVPTVIPEGVSKGDKTDYKYYVSETFNGETGIPGDWNVISGIVRSISEGQPSAADVAFRRIYKCSSVSATQYMNATDGNAATYWQPRTGDKSPWITVSLGEVKEIGIIEAVFSSESRISAVSFSVEGCRGDGEYSELVPMTEYKFKTAGVNTVSLELSENADISAVKLVFKNGDFRLSELKAYGSETEGNDRCLQLEADDSPAVLVKSFDAAASRSITAEFEISSSAPDRAMSVSLENSAKAAVCTVSFGADGYIYASDKDKSIKITYYEADKVYTLKLKVDLESGCYELWINQLRKAEGLETAVKGCGAAALAFTASEKYGLLNVDNVKVYDNTEIYLYSESFDGISKPSDNWSFAGEGREKLADYPFASDKSLMLASEKSTSEAVFKTAVLTGCFNLEVSVCPENAGACSMPVLRSSDGAILAGVMFYMNNLYAVNGDAWVKVTDGASPYAYYPAGNIYKIRLAVDTDKNRYDLYVDGALRMERLSLSEREASVNSVCFTVASENTAYINNLVIYRGRSLAGSLIDSAHIIDVKKAPYNAKGDGVTDDTEAIQRALDDAAYTGSTVLLDGGIFLTSTISVKSDTTLYINDGAVLRGIMNKYNYPLVECCEGLINYRQIGRGLILIQSASNVSIEGGGTVDGNGFYGYRVNDPASDKRLSDARPCVILAVLSENITVRNVSLVNSAFWTLVPMESSGVYISNVAVNSMNTPNRDGIDPCDVISCTIENCSVLAGDDGICFKSSCLYGCSDINVRNVTIQSRSNGIKFGSDTYGSLKNLSVSDVTMKNVVKAGITMQSSDGAVIERLVFERVTMFDVDDPIFLSVGNRCRTPLGNPVKRVGYMDDIVFRDISFTDAKLSPYSYDADIHEVLIIGLDNTHKITNVQFENVYLEMPGGYTSVPGFPGGVKGGYPEHYAAGKSNAWAYCVVNADNITFKNCKNVLEGSDARQEITYYRGYNTRATAVDLEVAYILPTRLDIESGDGQALTLPDTVGAVLEDGSVVELEVEWKTGESKLDAGVNGLYTIYGTVADKEGVGPTKGLKAVARITVTGNTDDNSEPGKSGASASMYIFIIIPAVLLLIGAVILICVLVRSKNKRKQIL